MRIAFDLDGTLLLCGRAFLTEAPTHPWVPFGEPLRRGARSLLVSLRAEDHELWVYTSSYRHPWRVRALFAAHGVGLDGVVTQRQHDRRFGRAGPLEAPDAFGIDVLVDDSQAVAKQCAGGACVVLLVRPEDGSWVERIRRCCWARPRVEVTHLPLDQRGEADLTSLHSLGRIQKRQPRSSAGPGPAPERPSVQKKPRIAAPFPKRPNVALWLGTT
jgi:hypothetical protein